MIKNKTILLTTLGFTWAVVPELLGFTSPLDFDLYQFHPEKADIEASRKEFSVPRVTDIWGVASAAMDESVQALKDWHRQRRCFYDANDFDLGIQNSLSYNH